MWIWGDYMGRFKITAPVVALGTPLRENYPAPAPVAAGSGIKKSAWAKTIALLRGVIYIFFAHVVAFTHVGYSRAASEDCSMVAQQSRYNVSIVIPNHLDVGPWEFVSGVQLPSFNSGTCRAPPDTTHLVWIYSNSIGASSLNPKRYGPIPGLRPSFSFGTTPGEGNGLAGGYYAGIGILSCDGADGVRSGSIADARVTPDGYMLTLPCRPKPDGTVNITYSPAGNAIYSNGLGESPTTNNPLALAVGIGTGSTSGVVLLANDEQAAYLRTADTLSQANPLGLGSAVWYDSSTVRSNGGQQGLETCTVSLMPGATVDFGVLASSTLPGPHGPVPSVGAKTVTVLRSCTGSPGTTTNTVDDYVGIQPGSEAMSAGPDYLLLASATNLGFRFLGRGYLGTGPNDQCSTLVSPGCEGLTYDATGKIRRTIGAGKVTESTVYIDVWPIRQRTAEPAAVGRHSMGVTVNFWYSA